MRLRTWPILALGFGALVLLTILFGLDSLRRTQQIYTDIVSIHQSHARADQALREIDAGIYVSGILIRDFLLDPSNLTAGLHRDKLREIRANMSDRLTELVAVTGEPDRRLLDQLHREVDSYWDSMDPIFEWTPQQKVAFSTVFLRKQVLPRREAVLQMAREVNLLNEANLRNRRQQIQFRAEHFGRSGRRILIGAVALSVIIALASILRISRLESRAARQHIRTERAEQELRRLSQDLVRAQEDERRSIARELHDEVGQNLTALRVELGNLEKLRAGSPEKFQQHMDDAKDLAEQLLKTIRNLAAGLRPAMLDDLGLGPALEWQSREFSRRTGIRTEVVVEGLPADLPEQHRTCLYRVVQEALTNCARHAQASQVRVALHTEADRLSLTVQDDGVGMANGFPAPAGGMGLIGVEERVRELGGHLAVQSQPRKGTLLKISIPLPQGTRA